MFGVGIDMPLGIGIDVQLGFANVSNFKDLFCSLWTGKTDRLPLFCSHGVTGV